MQGYRAIQFAVAFRSHCEPMRFRRADVELIYWRAVLFYKMMCETFAVRQSVTGEGKGAAFAISPISVTEGRVRTCKCEEDITSHMQVKAAKKVEEKERKNNCCDK